MNDLPLFRTTPKSAAQHRTASCLNSNESALFRFLTVHFPIRVSLSPANLDVTRTEKTDFLTSFAFMCFSVCVLSFIGEKRESEIERAVVLFLRQTGQAMLLLPAEQNRTASSIWVGRDIVKPQKALIPFRLAPFRSVPF